MMNSEYNTQAMDDISKYLSGEMNSQEMQDFESKLESQPQLRQEFDEVKDAWDSAEHFMYGTTNDINTDSAWHRLNSRIGRETEVHTIDTFYTPSSLLKWAAAILIIAGLGWIAYLNMAKSPALMVFENHDEQAASVMTLEDGSVVYLARHSQMIYPEMFSSKDRQVEIAGEAFFDVAHDSAKPFIIKAGNTTIEVLGTSFNVKWDNNHNFELFVETGRVKVWRDGNNNQGVQVESGQLITYRDEVPVIGYMPEYNTLWRRNVIQFRDEKLENILYALGKTYGYEFKAGDTALNDRMMTLTIHQGSIQTISELIALSLSLDYDIKNDSLVVFYSRK
jgi:transmembrane sensor